MILNNPLVSGLGSSIFTATESAKGSTLSYDQLRELQEDAYTRQEAFQTTSADTAMKHSSEEAQKLRDWQEEMSSTAYQRAVKDLKNAGLNPILATGAQSSTPGGGQGTAFAQSGASRNISEGIDMYKVMEFVSGIFGSAGKLLK